MKGVTAAGFDGDSARDCDARWFSCQFGCLGAADASFDIQHPVSCIESDFGFTIMDGGDTTELNPRAEHDRELSAMPTNTPNGACYTSVTLRHRRHNASASGLRAPADSSIALLFISGKLRMVSDAATRSSVS